MPAQGKREQPMQTGGYVAKEGETENETRLHEVLAKAGFCTSAVRFAVQLPVRHTHVRKKENRMVSEILFPIFQGSVTSKF